MHYIMYIMKDNLHLIAQCCSGAQLTLTAAFSYVHVCWCLCINAVLCVCALMSIDFPLQRNCNPVKVAMGSECD